MKLQSQSLEILIVQEVTSQATFTQNEPSQIKGSRSQINNRLLKITIIIYFEHKIGKQK